jgi:hypothetical protein
VTQFAVNIIFRGNQARKTRYIVEAGSAEEAERKAQAHYDRTAGAMRLDCYADADGAPTDRDQDRCFTI